MNIVYFDGVCNLCNSAINFLIDQDKRQRLKFASLQSDAGVEILQRFSLPNDDYDSFLFLKEGQLFQKSDAVLEIVKVLGGAWSLMTVFKIIPKSIRDWMYTKVAQNRYQWFGKRNECRLPTPELKARFL